ncbi:hypothetical protein FOZ63_029330 [Perkinsus olseni]|uniref:Uncharacterized protein n=1 Tax=Perkinsus olseni TaxID=32597 RepID=A0A7J6SUH7_PEROL|nr:hypothetical protein FOZ63_029330 [Perkinsus olseni]
MPTSPSSPSLHTSCPVPPLGCSLSARRPGGCPQEEEHSSRQRSAERNLLREEWSSRAAAVSPTWMYLQPLELLLNGQSLGRAGNMSIFRNDQRVEQLVEGRLCRGRSGGGGSTTGDRHSRVTTEPPVLLISRQCVAVEDAANHAAGKGDEEDNGSHLGGQ